MTHAIIEDLTQRYTAKKYNPSKKVSPEDLAVLLEALRLSASSINSQPWKFIVIESDEAKQRMHDSFAEKFQFNQPHIKACSHIILFANKICYTKQDYDVVINQSIADNRMSPENRAMAAGAYSFVESSQDAQGNHTEWTRAQTYIALGNALHTLARLKIDSTTMEGIDNKLLKEIFAQELDGYECHVALAIGYHDDKDDYNFGQPKSRLAKEQVIHVI
ncbi:Major NAD(P)H-flavin oxidoreductase [Vibrio aerogenes CECT 7868]|uniref:Major NAD(P)H-flavin oxidoreductase n=1 Tax=Vibrio aerogenes CECT 7868 TaxID=1216006 RepID=A0A1M6BZ24_9VIBR|nr:NAD(P)H-dependent oxidoreductase [Vibrio aerogenes]SHI53841.1 Major NAD(P)H-flavin oxidoreductase [Vibrio aerogenes CECT 7868]